MSGERKALNFGRLDDFPTKPKGDDVRVDPGVRDAVDSVSEFPSREKSVEAQLNIRAPEDVIARFKAMSKRERYTYGAFLEILMEAYSAR